MKITTAIVTNGAERIAYTVKKNGLAKTEFKTVNLTEGKATKVTENKDIVLTDKSVYDAEVFLSLREVILDYAEEWGISFYSALDEVAKVSQILQAPLLDDEIAILLNITTDKVKLITKSALKVLKKDREIRELSDELKLATKSEIMVKDRPNFSSEFFATGEMVV
jgi:hypothetical protein